MLNKVKSNIHYFLLSFSLLMLFLIVGSFTLKIITIEYNTNRILAKIAGQQQEKLAEMLLIHTAYKDGAPIELYRHGRDHDGGYVVPKIALESADALIGYGIADDASFEDQFSLTYKNKSYGYDCSVEFAEHSSELFEFVPECIATKDFLYSNSLNSDQMKVSSFSQHLQNHDLVNKKIFVKMDIEGAEYDAFDDILLNYHNVTGIVLEIHFKNSNIERAVNLLSKLNKYFLLLHVHGNNCVTKKFETSNAIGKIPYVIELTYINKSLIDKSHISKDQSHPTSMDMSNCKNRPPHKFTILNSR